MGSMPSAKWCDSKNLCTMLLDSSLEHFQTCGPQRRQRRCTAPAPHAPALLAVQARVGAAGAPLQTRRRRSRRCQTPGRTPPAQTCSGCAGSGRALCSSAHPLSQPSTLAAHLATADLRRQCQGLARLAAVRAAAWWVASPGAASRAPRHLKQRHGRRCRAAASRALAGTPQQAAAGWPACAAWLPAAWQGLDAASSRAGTACPPSPAHRPSSMAVHLHHRPRPERQVAAAAKFCKETYRAPDFRNGRARLYHLEQGFTSVCAAAGKQQLACPA